MSLADRALEGTVWFLPHLCCIGGVHWGSGLALRKYIAASSLVEGPFCEDEARPTTVLGAIFNMEHLYRQWASLPWLYMSSRTFITRRLHSQLAVDVVTVVHDWIMFALLACLCLRRIPSTGSTIRLVRPYDKSDGDFLLRQTSPRPWWHYIGPCVFCGLTWWATQQGYHQLEWIQNTILTAGGMLLIVSLMPTASWSVFVLLGVVQTPLMVGGIIDWLKSYPDAVAVKTKVLDVSGTLEPSIWILESQKLSLLPIPYILLGLLISVAIRYDYTQAIRSGNINVEQRVVSPIPLIVPSFPKPTFRAGMYGLTSAVITWGLSRPFEASVDQTIFSLIMWANLLVVGSVLLSLWSNAELKSFWKYNDKWTPINKPSATSSTDAEEKGVQIGDNKHVPGSSEKQSGEKVEDEVN